MRISLIRSFLESNGLTNNDELRDFCDEMLEQLKTVEDDIDLSDEKLLEIEASFFSFCLEKGEAATNFFAPLFQMFRMVQPDFDTYYSLVKVGHEMEAILADAGDMQNVDLVIDLFAKFLQKYEQISLPANPTLRFVLAKTRSDYLYKLCEYILIKVEDEPQHKSDSLLAQAQKFLAYGGVNNGQNLQILNDCNDPVPMAMALTVLSLRKLNTPANLALLKKFNKYVYHFAHSIAFFDDMQLPMESYADALQAKNTMRTMPIHVACAIGALYAANLVHEVNNIRQAAELVYLSPMIVILLKNGLLDSDNLKLILENAKNNPDSPLPILGITERIVESGDNRLTQNLLENIIRYAPHLDVSDPDDRFSSIYDRLPPHLFTEDFFNELIEIYYHANGNEQLKNERVIECVNYQLINHDAAYNDSQSTHTASVHRSVSISATRLYERYKQEIEGFKPMQIFAAMEKYLNGLPRSQRQIAAKKAFKKIKDLDYVDPGSTLSIIQLLALAWVAIHDDSLRIGTLDNALELLVEGLYEIQREYNISEHGVDKGGHDMPMCPGGKFNKLIEKLANIHPDVEVIFLSKQSATAKLVIVVKEELIAYFKWLANSPNGLGKFFSLLDEYNRDGIVSVYPDIRDKVAVRIWDEYGSLFQDRNDRSFTSFIDCGIYANVDLPDLRACVSQSDGYKDYCRRILTEPRLFKPQKQKDEMEIDTVEENKPLKF